MEKTITASVHRMVYLTIALLGFSLSVGAASSDREQTHHVLALVQQMRVHLNNKDMRMTPEEAKQLRKELEAFELELSSAVKRHEAIDATRAHAMAQKLFIATHPHANTTLLTESTDLLLYRIDKKLSAPNLGTFGALWRTVYGTLAPHTDLLLLAAVPLAAVGVYKVYDNLNERYGSSGKKSSGENSRAWEVAKIAFLLPAGKLVMDYCSKDTLKSYMDRLKELHNKMSCYLQGHPFKGANPASKSKVALKDAPVTESLHQTLSTMAQFLVHQEELLKIRALYPKVLLIAGDQSLGDMAAQALADEVTQRNKAAGEKITCMVARLHVTKLIEEPIKKTLELLAKHNEQCVLVLQDIDALARMSEEARMIVLREIMNGLKAAQSPYSNNLMIVATANSMSAVDPLLLSSGCFALTTTLRPHTDSAVLELCCKDLERTLGILPDEVMRHAWSSFLLTHNYGDLKVHMLKMYTEAHIAHQPVTANTIISALCCA